MPEALVRDFMSGQVHTVTADMALCDVAARMTEARVSCLVVCAHQGMPLGMVTERDLTRAYARDMGRGETMPVSSAMSQGVLTLTADARCADAMRVMGEHGVHRMVVVDADNRSTGIITRTDLLRAHAEALESQRQRLEQRVAERTHELEELYAHLAGLSRIDPLLGIGNRLAMDDELERVEQRARRYGRPYALALLGVDCFKSFNDQQGHGAGDDALRAVAGAVAGDIRATDAVFRYGGEELLVVLPEVDEEGAAIAAEHVRLTVEVLDIPHRHSPHGRVTVSIGVAGCVSEAPGWNATLARTDRALHAAKKLGRNRVERPRTRERAA